MSKVGILGASGRIGTLLMQNISQEKELEVSCVFSKEKVNLRDNCIHPDNIEDFLNNCDGVIDFSMPQALESMLEVMLNKKIFKPLVVGTTGLNTHQQHLLEQVSEFTPVCYSTNMSLGVAVLNEVVSIVSKRLASFDCEIVEQHHKYKQDAPSGTALTLASSAAKARGLDLDKVRVSGRDGQIGARSKDEIAVMALRGGDIAGRHTVGFYNDGEFLELNHTATSRETFSKGAISVFKWLLTQKEAKLYSINDFLGLS